MDIVCINSHPLMHTHSFKGPIFPVGRIKDKICQGGKCNRTRIHMKDSLQTTCAFPFTVILYVTPLLPAAEFRSSPFHIGRYISM